MVTLSQSKLSRLLRCPRSFDFAYVKKVPVPVAARMVLGSTYHAAVARILTMRTRGVEPTQEEVYDFFQTAWQANVEQRTDGNEGVASGIDWQGEAPADLFSAGCDLAQKFNAEVAPTLRAKAVELRRERVLPNGITFLGYLDALLEPDDSILDHKLSRRAMPQRDADKDLQASAYAYLLGKPSTISFLQALDLKEPRFNTVVTTRGEADMDWFEVLAVEASKVIEHGVFPPSPLGWWCGPEICAYFAHCRTPSWF